MTERNDRRTVTLLAMLLLVLTVPRSVRGETAPVPEVEPPTPASLEEPAPADDGPPPVPDRPRLEIQSGDGQSSIRFQLAVQLQYYFQNVDRGPNADRENDDAVIFRRIRPVISGSLLTESLTYRLHLNLVPGALELMDFWFNYRFHAQAQMLVGQNKVPFTRYRLDSFQDTPLVDWSNPTRFFGAERQLGVMLHNDVSRPPRWEYQLGVYTGDNARASNGVGLSRTYGETPANPSNLTDPAPPSGFHPEIVAHLGYNHPDMNVRRPSDLEGGPLRYSFGLSAAWDIRPTPTEDWALRLAPEVLIKAHGFMAQGVFYAAFWDDVATDDSFALGAVAALLQTSYVIRRRVEIALRYSLVHITEDLRNDARTRADGIIADAADDEEAEALTRRYASVGHVIREHELNLGVTVYAVATTLKLAIDGGLLGHERDDGTRWDFRLRTQAQLAF